MERHPMTPERWQQITELFEAVLERPAAERAQLLTSVCKGDREPRAELESLLAEHERANSFIQEPVLDLSNLRAAQGVESKEHSFATGRMLGHYQILEKLGEGGMGVVYKARDTHLDRWVAVKLLPPEKVADPERKRRFVKEAK